MQKRQKYGSSLPNDWLDIVQSRPDMFSISVQATNLSIIFKNELKKRDDTKLTCNNSRSNQKDSVKLPPLELPWNQSTWDVHVSWVTSTADFWVQLFESELMVSGKARVFFRMNFQIKKKKC